MADRPTRRLRAILEFLRRIFSLDYSLAQSYIRYAAVFGAIAYLFFYFTEASMGYRDWWPLRAACILAALFLTFFPVDRKPRAVEIAYYEFVGWLLLPVAQSFLFLLNRPDAYWTASITFTGLLLGLLSKPQWFLLHMATGIPAGIGLFTLVNGRPDPESVRILFGLLPITFMNGCLALGIQSGLAIFHRRGVDLAAARERAATATAAFEDLQRRETVITRFVRPSLCAELAKGDDPTVFEPVEKELAVLFCDIRDFTALTEVLGPRDKQSFLNRYFSLMTRPIARNGGEVDKIMGDCVMAVFPDGRSAVAAAVEMRLELQAFNAGMLAQGKPKIRNGIGIAKGPVLLANFGSHEKLDRTVIGEAVNIAARLESKTKMYNLEIVVTEDVIRDLPPEDGHRRWIDVVRVKGSTRRLRLFEIYGHQPPEVRAYKDGSRDLLEKALTIYFRKGFKDALRMFRAMQAQVPPHLHAPGAPMDDLLGYYISHCEAWSSDTQGMWERMEKWDGVHAFLEK